MDEVIAADGWRLAVTVVAPTVPARAVAVCLHAMMVDGRTFLRGGAGLAHRFAGAGIAALVADLRGHGGSGPTVRRGGTWTYDDLVRRDLPALVDAARARFPGVPVAVVGHSLGGHAALASAAEGGIRPDRIALLAANVWRPSLEPSRRRRARKAWSMAQFSAVNRLFGYFPSRRLRMGPCDEAGPYVADLVRFWRSDRWSSRDGLDWTARLPTVDVPVLSVLSTGDALMGHPVASERWVRAVRSAEVWTVGKTPGLPEIRPPGHVELVTDPASAPLWDAIARWVLAG